MIRYVGYALILIAFVTVIVLAMSQYVQPILPQHISSVTVLFFAILISVVGFLAGFKDTIELLKFFSKSNNSVQDEGGKKSQQVTQHSTFVDRTENVIVQTFLQNIDKKSVAEAKVIHNLPQPDYGQFIGRENELTQVVRILRPYPYSQHPLVTIDGIGGIGKTTLALEIAHRYLRNHEKLSPEERFDTIIWNSAKQSVLTVEGIVTRQKAIRTIDGIYNTIARVLQIPDFDRAAQSEKASLIVNALTKHNTLLIVDNLETVDDEAVMEFLRELPAPTKAIVTTRHRLDVAYPIRLVGMPEKDAQKLIAQECEKKAVILNETDMRRLYQRTSGVPLAVVWSIAQIAFGYSVEIVLKRLGQPNDDISRFCFEEVMNQIRKTPAYDLIGALALAESDLSRDELGYIADFREDILSRDEGLVQLETLSLIHKVSGKFSLLPLVRQFVLEDIRQYPNKESFLIQRITIPKGIFIDESSYNVWVEGRQVRLSRLEFSVLLYLYNHSGKVCSKEEIIEAAYGLEFTDRKHSAKSYISDSMVSAMMSRLRRKIEPAPSHPKYLQVIRGAGYKLTIDTPID